MSGRRVAGLVLVVIGVVLLALGGVFWTKTNTIVDAGPLKVDTHEREGVSMPPLVGIATIVVGVIMLVIPARARS